MGRRRTLQGGDSAQPVIQGNRDLILTGFDDHMHQVFGSRTRVPCRCTVRSNQMEDFEYSQRSNMQTSEGKEIGTGKSMAMCIV